MNSIAFIDTEIEPKSRKILDIGSVKDNGHPFHSPSVADFITFLRGTEFICGHNIFNHDLKYMQKAVNDAGLNPSNAIDTLFLSPLLFPTKPYHALLKDDKLQVEDTNNPLNDSKKAKDLFYDEVSSFNQTDESLKQIFYLLLNEKKEFHSFFHFIAYKSNDTNVEKIIREKFHSEICEQANLAKIISEHPIELAYCLSLINCNNRYSITPPWVLKNYPEIERVMFALRNKPCLTGCTYCNRALNIHKGLKRYFGFDAFRSYAGEALQENAVKAAIDNKSILAVFPTGGGKSITFQVPALMSGDNSKGLTVIISPLQSLMKDQVDNLEKSGITDAVTINGLLDPIERAKSFERVADGSASILYISPESLRSRTIERLLLGRKIVRFVIDEAHCFSSWGQDFRVDYLYIGDFIKSLQDKKNLEDGIPVSCFTATAKQKVIEDIRDYFKQKLSLDLELFASKASRTNLHYKVFEKSDEEEKYNSVRDLVEEKKCPTIIYVSRRAKAVKLASRLTEDGFSVKPFHGGMSSNEKTENQNQFISGAVQIMVATSAFGMGVDKKDIGMVIHFEISDSLENYIQEAGRAGRDENITADCFVLFNEEDLGKHFILLNQTKLSIKEIQQVWKAIKEITRFRSTVSNSALEIARKAGWDDNVIEIETRVITAIAALEDAGYLKRGQNMPRVFANSILSKTAQDAIDKINASQKFEEKQKEKGIRIIKKLFSSKSRKETRDEAAESRIDYIGDHLGIVTEEVISIVNLLREEKILADAKDLTAFIKKGEHKNRSQSIVETFSKIEFFLLPIFEEQEKTFHLKELNEAAEHQGCENVTPNKIKTIINFWAIKHWIKRYNPEYSKNHVVIICVQTKESLKEKLEKRHQLAKFVVDYLYEKSKDMDADEFALINSLMEQNEEMRVIVVGDDDQNIYEFRGAHSKYLEQFIAEKKATKHELVENFRSKKNLVAFTNEFVKKIPHRLKQTPIIANQKDNGKIKVVRYTSNNLITPLVHNIRTTGLAGTTCVLTKTNEEASQITGLLLKTGMQAKLIQTNDNFSLYNLAEVRFFLNELKLTNDVFVLSDEIWDDAKRALKNKFQQSSKIEICNNIVKDFEVTNPKKKYKSDLEVFIRESKLEDFFDENGETIFVSTIHKAKGKEFDNVFLMLENIDPATDETKRLLYVAMTRAKENLYIHLNGNYLDNITAENIESVNNEDTHLPPNVMAMHLTHKDVWLDYFITRQHLVSNLISGDTLTINGDECKTLNGHSVLKFSKQFMFSMEAMNQKGFRVKQVSVNFIVHWLKENTEHEIKIILPELYFERSS